MRIQQVILFKRSGKCILSFGHSDTGLSQDLFSGLLSALNAFSMEALGLELCELIAQNLRVFLNRTDSMILAVVTKGSVGAAVEFKPRVFALMERICRLLKLVEDQILQSQVRGNREVLEWLRTKIEQEVTRGFPVSAWIDFHTLNEQLVLDIATVRILTYLSDQEGHTRYELRKQFGLSRPRLEAKLDFLRRKGLIMVEPRLVGTREVKQYTISELGKFATDNLETHFSGLWFQSSQGN
ncbi:MAG: MarR family transcriptional regulator [Candidatus Heimdallarchaeota archaeon]